LAICQEAPDYCEQFLSTKGFGKAIISAEMFGSLEYNLDEFDASTIERWIADYGRLVAEAVADPDRPWRSL